jgi:hypothetical protein
VAEIEERMIARLRLHALHVDNGRVHYRPEPVNGPEAAGLLDALVDPRLAEVSAARVSARLERRLGPR